MKEATDLAVEALKLEIDRGVGDLTKFDPARPLRALMDAGFSPDEASEALDRAEEILGIWS